MSVVFTRTNQFLKIGVVWKNNPFSSDTVISKLHPVMSRQGAEGIPQRAPGTVMKRGKYFWGLGVHKCTYTHACTRTRTHPFPLLSGILLIMLSVDAHRCYFWPSRCSGFLFCLGALSQQFWSSVPGFHGSAPK